MSNHIPMQRIFPAVASALILASATPAGWAQDGDGDEDEMEFAEAELFFELNNTDGDLGIHALIDGDAWKKMTIEDPNERKMLNVNVKGRLRKQGLTEIFFESAEPRFEELAPAEFFKRFPAGEYEIGGNTLTGEELESTTELTHVMPAPAVPEVNGATVAMQCDAEEPGYDAPAVSPPIIIDWEPVTMSHPEADGGGAGVQPPVPVTIYNYQVVVEVQLDIGGEEFASVFSIILPPGQTSMEIPDEFIALGKTFKYEVLAREISFNQTAVESCFMLAE